MYRLESVSASRYTRTKVALGSPLKSYGIMTIDTMGSFRQVGA